jgi:hypothetical protein
MRWVAWLALLVATGLAAPDRPAARPVDVPSRVPVDVRATGRLLTRWFDEGAWERLWPRLSPALRRVVGGRDGLGALRADVRARAGRVIETLDETLVPWLDSTIYNRTVRRDATEEPWWTQWTIRGDRALALIVVPSPRPAPTAHAGRRTVNALRLPFRGRWFVYWGGRTPLENHHAVSLTQRFAYDFFVARRGRTHRAAARRANTDFYCWGQPVLAPAAGVVRTAVDGVPDNTPGAFADDRPFGNHVVLDLGEGEYAWLAHLRRTSVRVRPGQRVAGGDQLGECGNSGRSSEPHLHFHLQDTDQAHAGAGLPAAFRTYWADGRSVAIGEPKRGQFVAPGSPATFR